MQVVAASPRYLTPADAPAEHRGEGARDRDRAARRLAEGKPAEIVAKMIEGRLRKSINEFALTGQVFVKDGDLTIEKLLKDEQGEREGVRTLRSRRRHRKEAGRFRGRSHGAGQGGPDQDRPAGRPSTSRHENPASRGVFFMAKCARVEPSNGQGESSK